MMARRSPARPEISQAKTVHGTTPPRRVTTLQAHWSHGISAALLGVLILLPAPPASAQSRDDFSYWDANGNGDLTCPEAEGRDEGLRLPAYQDNRDRYRHHLRMARAEPIERHQ